MTNLVEVDGGLVLTEDGFTQNADRTLALLEHSISLLSEARRIQDVKQIHDFAKAAKVYAAEHKLGREVVLKARALMFEALRRIGELLKETDRAPGGQPYQKATGSNLGPVATLAELGISKKTSSVAQQLFALPPHIFARVRDSQMTLDQTRTEAKDAKEAAEEQRIAAWFAHVSKFEHIDEELRVCSRTELFASGITADAVITDPPFSRQHLSEFSELSRACANVPLVAVRMASGCICLPEILGRLREHLTYRSSIIIDKRLILIFCADAWAIARANARRAGSMSGVRSTWAEYLVQRLTDPGGLVVDPFMTTGVALAALQKGRRFVGGTVDVAAASADLQRRIEEA